MRVHTEGVGAESVVISGRGDLHLGVLLERMRREGYEMAITPPEVVCQIDEKTGERLEPYEDVKIDVDLEYVSDIVENLNNRKGILLNAEQQSDGRQLL
jgi:GTP-binding protein